MVDMMQAGFKGPSPRGRGNRMDRFKSIDSEGTIPAWAGEPACRSSASTGGKDHPRVGGGTEQFPACRRQMQGPSPRGRGNRFQNGAWSAPSRTIPAWAGEPNRRWGGRHDTGDHPRVGVGTALSAPAPGAIEGPSPRGRGNRQQARVFPAPDRTIPAWAGEPA